MLTGGNIGGYIEASEVDGFDLEATYDMHASEDSTNHFGTFITKSASNGFRITTNCENVELACQWGDWWYSEEGSLLANYGVEGEGFEYVDGVPTFTSLVTDSDLGMRDALLVYASNGTINCVIDNNAVASGYSEVDKAAPRDLGKGHGRCLCYPHLYDPVCRSEHRGCQHLLRHSDPVHGVHRQVHHR